MIRMKQVVLFHISGEAPVLFYHDAVYTAPQDVETLDLPSPLSGSFIWLLMDLSSKELAKFVTDPGCFPVQAPSPNPHSYKEWRKARTPLYTGFPLWTYDELASA